MRAAEAAKNTSNLIEESNKRIKETSQLNSQVVEAMAAVRTLASKGMPRTAMEEAFFALQFAPTYLPLHVQIGEMLLVQADHFKRILRICHDACYRRDLPEDLNFPEIRSGWQAGYKNIAAVGTFYVNPRLPGGYNVKAVIDLTLLDNWLAGFIFFIADMAGGLEEQLEELQDRLNRYTSERHKALAEEFAKEKAKMVIAARRTDRLEALKAKPSIAINVSKYSVPK